MLALLKQNKKLVIINSIILGIIIVGIFFPTLYSKSYAQDKLGTQVELYNKSIFTPEYVSYLGEGEDGSLMYIKLGRKYIFGWQVVDQKEQVGDVDKLKKSINEGILIPDDLDGGIDLEAIERNSNSPNYDPGSVTTSIETLTGDKIEVILGDNQQDNELSINDTLTGIKNIYGLSASLDDKYLYYTKFSSETLEDGFIITRSDDKVYKYALGKKTESVLYDFGQKPSISFKVNNDYIFYANEKNEVGTINLATKQKSTFDTSKLGIDLNVEINGDIGYTPLSVLNIDDESGILAVDIPNQDAQYFRIRLADLAIQR